MSSNQKLVLVFGGSGRLGAEVIKSLNPQTLKVVNLSSRHESSLPHSVDQVEIDLTNRNSLLQVISELSSKYGLIYGVINFAGRSKRRNSSQIRSDLVFNNMRNDTLILLYILEFLTCNRGFFDSPFRLIDIGSLWSTKIPKSSIYLDLGNEPDLSTVLAKSMKKRIVQYMAKMSDELEVFANQVTPGWFPRPSASPRPDYIAAIVSGIPMGRIGQPQEIVSAIEFLLDSRTTYVNGHELFVDGGVSLF